MSKTENQTTSMDAELQEMLAQSDTGARDPQGIAKKILLIVPFIWALFQLWYASPLPFVLNFGIINDTEARSIHLAFAIFFILPLDLNFSTKIAKNEIFSILFAWSL